MQRLSDLPLSIGFILCLTLTATFHSNNLAHAQDFNLPSGGLTSASFISLKGGVVDSSGTLTLNATVGEAQAFYASPITLSDTISRSLNSFSTFFTFSANASSGNGTVALVMVPDASQSGGLAEARKTFTIEFNTTCSTGPLNGSWFHEGHAFPGSGGGRGHRGGRGFFRGLGGFQVVEYANETVITAQTVSGYGPNWDGSFAPPPYFCSQNPLTDLNNPTFQYQVVVEYNASTDTVWVGSPSCGNALARTTQFVAQDLSSVLSGPVYVGFIVTGGGIFDLSQWNFTSNANTSSVTSLALSSAVDTTTPAGISDGGRDGRGGSSDGKLGKGYVVAFSVLGAAIGVAAVAGVCCLCVRRRRRRRAPSPMFVAKGVGTIPESKLVFDAAKPPMAPRTAGYERDTAPLNTQPHSTSHSNSTGAASWLQPVAPR